MEKRRAERATERARERERERLPKKWKKKDKKKKKIAHLRVVFVVLDATFAPINVEVWESANIVIILCVLRKRKARKGGVFFVVLWRFLIFVSKKAEGAKALF